MKIYCATHLPLPQLNETGVIPVFVGQGPCPEGWLSDKVGDNIADRNPSFCELTAQYWVWKNKFDELTDDDRVGFCHYRRFFCKRDDAAKRSLNYQSIQPKHIDALDQRFSELACDGFIASGLKLSRVNLFERLINLDKLHTRYFWFDRTVGAQFAFYHDERDLKQAVVLLDGGYREQFARYLSTATVLHPFNMYISTRKIMDEYFSVLFPWLFVCEQKIVLDSNSRYQQRFFGFLAERFASFYFSQIVPQIVPIDVALVNAE